MARGTRDMDVRLNEVRVENDRKMPVNGDSEFTYVNPAFVNSTNNVSVASTDTRTTPQPITGVYREQYWACSRWPYTQRVLAIAVGILLGAVIGLAISMALSHDDSVIGGIFVRTSVLNR